MPETRLTLYTTSLSANGRKPLAVCHHLGLEPKIVEVNVYRGEGRSPEYLAINPWGKVPTLVDGDFTLWESNAIVQYLSEAHGEYRLSSRDPRRRADIGRWLSWEAAHWQPSFYPILAELVGLLLRGEHEAAEKIAVTWHDPTFRSLATHLDEHLARHHHLAGDELTLADFCVAGMMTYARRARFPFAELPAIARWYEGIEETAAWQASAVDPWKV